MSGTATPVALIRLSADERTGDVSPPGGRAEPSATDLVDLPVPASSSELLEGRYGRRRLPDVRVLLVDDCMLFRDDLAAALATSGAVVTVARDVPTLVTAASNAGPEIVLVNISTFDSATLLDAAATTFPNAWVIVLGVAEDDEATIVACAEAGVSGYHTRNQSLDDLLDLVANVVTGESACSPRVSAVLLRRLSTLASEREPVRKELVLTTREAQILQMLRVGMSNREIAAQLSIAVHTVKNHVHSLLSKLGVTTRAEAAALPYGARRGRGGPRN